MILNLNDQNLKFLLKYIMIAGAAVVWLLKKQVCDRKVANSNSRPDRLAEVPLGKAQDCPCCTYRVLHLVLVHRFVVKAMFEIITFTSIKSGTHLQYTTLMDGVSSVSKQLNF